MSGLTGKGQRSYKKANVSDSNNPALGFKSFQLAFQAPAAGLTAGTAITFTNLPTGFTVPAEMITAGFQQPTGAQITNAQLGTFRNNVSVISNLNDLLIDRISYSITDETITFDDELNSEEIIVIKRGNEVVTGNRIVDARPLRASGTVDFSTIGSSPVVFQTGEGFRIAPSTTATGGIDNRQIGFVQVFVDGVLQARNVGNEDESTNAMADQTGNYREVLVNTATNAVIDPQNGVTANAVQFNQFQPFSSEEGVIVISTNLIVDAPNSTGVLDQIDSVQAQVTANDVDIAANTGNIATNTTELATIPTVPSSSGTQTDYNLRVSAAGNTNTWEAASSGGAGVLSITTYEVGTGGVYAIPDNATALEIEGAGAGANGTVGNLVGGNNGGQGGQYNTRFIPLTAGTGRTLTVGIGTSGGNTTLTNLSGSALGATVTWLGNYSGATTGNSGASTRSGSDNDTDGSGGEGGASRGRGGAGATVNGFLSGGGGGGGGWVDGGNGASADAGTGAHGGMVIKALGITVTAG